MVLVTQSFLKFWLNKVLTLCVNVSYLKTSKNKTQYKYKKTCDIIY